MARGRGRGRGARRAWAGVAVAVAVGAAAAGAASADRGLAAIRSDRSGLSDDERAGLGLDEREVTDSRGDLPETREGASDREFSTTTVDEREFSTTTEDEREFSTTTEDEREPPSDAETYVYISTGDDLFKELRETREGASAGGYLFSPAQEAESWICQAYGSHDGQNHEDKAVEVVCLDPETMEDLAAPGFKKSGAPSGWTEEELLAPANELACASAGGAFVTHSCGLTYLAEDGFSFEDFTNKFDRRTQGVIIDITGEICCGGQNVGKKIAESDLCAVYSGRAAVAADEVDRSRKLYGNKCMKGEEDITKTLEGFWGGNGEYSREVVLSSTNQEICKAAGGTIELETCGSFNSYYQNAGYIDHEAMKFALDEVAPLCCPPRSDDDPMFTLEQEKESYLCKTWGYHDNVKRSQNIMDVKCKGAFGEELECSDIDGMKCSAAEGFSQEELASPANKEVCDAAVGGFENTPGSKFTTNTCEMAYMDNKFFSFEKYLRTATGDNEDTMHGYLNYIAPTCCGKKPLAQSQMCGRYSRGFDDEVDRSEKVLNVECQKRKEGDDDDFEDIDVPGFKAFSVYSGSDSEATDWGEVLSTENNDVCLAGGGDRVEVLTCEKAERHLSMYMSADSMPENVKMYLEMTQSHCCPQSPEAEEERKKDGVQTEKDSFVCSNYGFHDGRGHAATVFSVSCKVGDEEIDCEDIPGFACDATIYSEAELLSEENKAICEAHTDGATFEHLTCGVIFSPFWEASVKSSLEDNPDGLAATVGYLGSMCCGQKPMSDTKLCQGGKGGLSDEEMMTKDISNRLVSATCEKKGETDDDDKTIFNVPGSVGFASSDLDFEAARGVSKKEVTSKENQQKCFEAGGDHVKVTTCAKAADYYNLLPPGSIPAIYYDPILKLCCPANGREAVGPPTSGGNFMSPEMGATCQVAKAVMKAAKDSRVMGAPALRGPGVKELGWNLDSCRASHT